MALIESSLIIIHKRLVYFGVIINNNEAAACFSPDSEDDSYWPEKAGLLQIGIWIVQPTVVKTAPQLRLCLETFSNQVDC